MLPKANTSREKSLLCGFGRHWEPGRARRFVNELRDQHPVPLRFAFFVHRDGQDRE